jgi:hypothetical protein
MDFTAEDYRALKAKLVAAARTMKSDGWWVSAQEYPEKEKRMRVRLLQEMLRSFVLVPPSVRTFYTAVMCRKDDDHHASHNNAMNQYLHLVSDRSAWTFRSTTPCRSTRRA